MKSAAELYREEIRFAFAETALEDAMNFGALVPYQDTALAPLMKLWVMPHDQQRKLDKAGPIQEEQTTIKFSIPRQASWQDFDAVDWVDPDQREHFPPNNRPATNAIIHYEGYEWAVSLWTSDAVEAVFIGTATRHQPRRIDENE